MPLMTTSEGDCAPLRDLIILALVAQDLHEDRQGWLYVYAFHLPRVW